MSARLFWENAATPKRQNYDRKKVRNSYWRRPERNLAGNTIHFHTQVLGLSFQQAMHDITNTPAK